jgi:hypothetical protein
VFWPSNTRNGLAKAAFVPLTQIVDRKACCINHSHAGTTDVECREADNRHAFRGSGHFFSSLLGVMQGLARFGVLGRFRYLATYLLNPVSVGIRKTFLDAVTDESILRSG